LLTFFLESLKPTGHVANFSGRSRGVWKFRFDVSNCSIVLRLKKKRCCCILLQKPLLQALRNRDDKHFVVIDRGRKTGFFGVDMSLWELDKNWRVS
jgi:hypothetical protein